jgi:hypothetical protein
MNKRNQLRHRAQARSNDVCAEQQAVFDATPGGSKTVQKLAGSVARYQTLSADLERHLDVRTAATKDCRTGRRDVRKGLNALVTIAPFAALDQSDAKEIRLPRTKTDDELVSVTREVLEKVAPHAQAFIDQGLPGNVLTDLPTALEAFAKARLAAARARRDYTTTSGAMTKTLNDGDEAIRVADTILRHAPSAPADAVQKLRIAKRVGPRTTAHPPAETPAASTPTAPTTTPKVA